MSDVIAPVQPQSDAPLIPKTDSEPTKPTEPPQSSSSTHDNSRKESTEVPEEEEDAVAGAVPDVEDNAPHEEEGKATLPSAEDVEVEANGRNRTTVTIASAADKPNFQERQNIQRQKDRDYLFAQSQQGFGRESEPKPSVSPSQDDGGLKAYSLNSPPAGTSTNPASQLSHIEQLLGTTREILRVLTEQRDAKISDVERDAANDVQSAGRRALKKFLQINQPWDLVRRDEDWDQGMPLSKLEEFVTEAERRSNVLKDLCDDIVRNSSAPSLLSVEHAAWLIKRLVVLKATIGGSFVLDHNLLSKTADGMHSWLLGFFDSFNRIGAGLNLLTVSLLSRIILALVRCSGLWTLQIGEVMLQCRKDGIFEELHSLTNLKKEECEMYFRLIAKADCCLNFTSKVFANAAEVVVAALTIPELLSINIYKLSLLWQLTDSSLVNPLAAVIQKIQSLESSDIDPSNDAVKTLGGLIKAVDFETEDLNIEILTTIGGLAIEWTMFYDQHLVLDKTNRILRVSWFPAPPIFNTNKGQRKEEDVLSDWYIKSLQSSPFYPDQNGGVSVSVALNRELHQTWTLLFRSSEKKLQEDLRKSYKEVKVPSWSGKSANKTMATVIAPENTSKYWTSDFHFETETAHRHSLAVLGARKLDYSNFPIYEQRLRALRAYMDSAKPRGLLQLWKDNRDSLSYYTFWGVIIFGGLSFIIAFFSLTVSVSQTVASFEALHASPGKS